LLTFANKYDNITKLSRGGRSGPERREEAERKVRKKFLTRRTEADIINRLSRKKRAKRLEKNQKKVLDKKGWT
jgi:hypothetical protein